jgi:hypothetical protein
VEAAAKMLVPQRLTLKTSKDPRLIGKPVKRLYSPGKVDGAAKLSLWFDERVWVICEHICAGRQTRRGRAHRSVG